MKYGLDSFKSYMDMRFFIVPPFLYGQFGIHNITQLVIGIHLDTQTSSIAHITETYLKYIHI